MKNKLFATLVALCISSLLSTTFAVPAYPGWRTMEQPDGTTIELRLVGDEFYHYWINRDGQQVAQNEEGYYVVATEQLTKEQVAQRRAASPMKKIRPRKAVDLTGKDKGIIILVNFSDKTFSESNPQQIVYNMMMNDSYSYGGYTGSAHKYFYDQSNGQYDPQFTVVGPVTLSNTSYYYAGSSGMANTSNMVKDACTAANGLVNFADFSSDGETVDFVYIIYAGQSKSESNCSDCVWPHQYWVKSGAGISCKLDGVYIDMFACSSELRTKDSNKNTTDRAGIGTFCHEFSHVLGLPDYYDTNYGKNDGNTPGDWTLMDQGSYNCNGYCPPNYSIYDKYFIGWVKKSTESGGTLKLLTTDPANGVLSSTSYGDGYQINSNDAFGASTSTTRQYYLENRKQAGWDAGLPNAGGLVIWQVDYNADYWEYNEVNSSDGEDEDEKCEKNTSGVMCYQLVGNDRRTTNYTPIANHAITNITGSGTNTVTFTYNGGVSCHNITSNATNCSVSPSVSCVENGKGFTATITPVDATYDITSVTVKRGTTNLTSGTHYTLSGNKQTLTVNASAVTGSASDAFTITAVATKNRCTYGVLSDPDVCTISSDEGTITINSALNLTITASGYYLGSASCWEVEMGGSTLTYGTGFTYNTSTGAFSITKVTGNVEIYVYPNYTVTWSVDGVTTPAYFAKDAALVLPATPSDCSSGDKVFVGWTADGTFSGGDTAPDDLFTTAGTKTVTGNITYYAVYATESSSAPIRKAGETTVFSDDLNISGTSSVSSRTGWASFSSAYGGDGSIRLSTGKAAGSMRTNALTSLSGTATISFKIKAWTTSENGKVALSVSKGTLSTSSFTETTGSFVDCSTTLTGGDNTTTLTFTGTSGKRVYIKELLITSGGGKTYSDYALNCGAVVPVDPECSFTTTSKTLTFGESFTQTLTTNSNGVISYSSSNTAVATVDNSGVITTTGIGNTTIYGSTAATAKYNAGTNCASYTITVNKVSPVVTFTSPTTSVQNGQSVTNTATVTPSGYTITYSSNNTAVATVDNSGKITTVSTGSATITATVAEGATWNAASDSYNLSVTEAPSLQVTWSTPNGNLTDANAMHLYVTGETLLMPTTTPSCAGRTFVGWTAMADYTSKDAAPSDLFTTAGSKTVTSAVTYYAVFY